MQTNTKEFRVIIAGSRDFSDYDFLRNTMDYLLQNITDRKIIIICGMARGADTLGEQYAKFKKYEIRYFPADWEKFGKSAGYIRNKQMAQNADALVAFWDGISRGTKLMIDLANEYKLDIRIKKIEK